MKKLVFLSIFICLLLPFEMFSQEFSRQDSLRGSITAERVWWDLMHYSIEVKPDIPNKSISGKNSIRYKNFTLTCNFDWKQGGDMWSHTSQLLAFTGNSIQTTYNNRT